jgi:hypothetical protein
MINQWLAIMYSHIHSYNSLIDFYLFFFIYYFSMTITKTKKNKDCGKISLFVAKTLYCV